MYVYEIEFTADDYNSLCFRHPDFLPTSSFAPQFHAMDTLHNNGYDMTRAIAALVPQGGPVLCRDEMEEWSASEANLFEEALEKYGKDFTDIQQDFVSLHQ